MIKSFKGMLTHLDLQTIRLGTIKGEMGYIIKKFQLISETPNALDSEAVCKIFANPQSVATREINFNDSTLLAVSYFSNSASPLGSFRNIIIFDNVKVNQDIFITMFSGHTDPNCNYYIELEERKLNHNEAMIATLKDMRGSN